MCQRRPKAFAPASGAGAAAPGSSALGALTWRGWRSCWGSGAGIHGAGCPSGAGAGLSPSGASRSGGGGAGAAGCSGGAGILSCSGEANEGGPVAYL